MRFTISSTALSSKLLSLSRVINSKNTLSILDCFLFEAKDNQLFITASDRENVMRTTLNLDSIEGDGVFAVNNRNILDAVKELPEQPLTIDVNISELKMYVSYQNGSYSFPIVDANEYPQTPPLEENATTISIEAGCLSDNLTRSLFATAQDELRPAMNGVYFDLKEDCLTIVATDGQKLVRNRNTAIKGEVPAAFILPKKPASLLKGVLAKESGDVVIKFDARSAEISFAEGSLTCRLIEGKYPNYNGVIPKDNPHHIVIDRKTLIGGIRRVLPFANDASQLIRFHIENGQLDLSTEDVDFSTSAKESITCDYNGTAMSIGLKGPNMLDILNNLQGDDINIQLADPSRAVVIFPSTQEETEETLMVIMPALLNY